MGDIADMMLDGTLDEETGEYLGDFNKEIFGTESPGFPISLEREECPICEKKVKPGGLAQHMSAAHGPGNTTARHSCAGCNRTFKTAQGAAQHFKDVH